MNERKITFSKDDLRTILKTLHDDKGGEYISGEFDTFCRGLGIEHRHTQKDVPQQNGAAERLNRTIAEGITTLLNEAKLPPSLWVDAASTFIYVINRLPPSNNNRRSPAELWYGHIPSVERFRTWGCEAYVYAHKDQRSGQFGSHAKRCIFIGYPPDYNGWTFIDLASGNTFVSDSAVFHEKVFPGKIRDSSPHNHVPLHPSFLLPVDIVDNVVSNPTHTLEFPLLINTNNTIPTTVISSSDQSIPNKDAPPPPIILRIPSRLPAAPPSSPISIENRQSEQEHEQLDIDSIPSPIPPSRLSREI
jgi:hypothetical protein